MFLHYFFLAVFAWMLVEGVNLYLKVVKVFGSEKNLLPMFFAIGWGSPAVIVIISAGVEFSNYTSPNR